MKTITLAILLGFALIGAAGAQQSQQPARSSDQNWPSLWGQTAEQVAALKGELDAARKRIEFLSRQIADEKVKQEEKK